MAEPVYRVRELVDPPVPDTPGRGLKPDPRAVGDVTEFVAALNDLRAWAGCISLRTLSERCGGVPVHATFWNLLHAERLPKLQLVLAFVDALGLGGEREAWCEAWRRLALERSQARG